MKSSTPYKDLFDISIPNGNVCPISKTTRDKNRDISRHPPEIKELIEKYKKLSEDIKRVRGILYKHGIDPENLK